MSRILAKVTAIFEVPKYNAAFMAINLLLGAGPIIVPEPFFEAGFLLSTFWTAVILALSLNSAMYVGESMQAIAREKAENEEGQNSDTVVTDHKASLLSNEDNPLLLEKDFESVDHVEQFRVLYGERWKFFPAVAIAIYLFGVSISKCIMTGNTLSKVFRDVPLLGTFEFWLSVFFISGAAFSFKSISKTKPLQVITITVRFVSVFLMILGAFIIMGQNGGVETFTPEGGNAFFNFSYFGDIFSNLVFSFMFHHSIPTITQTLKRREEIDAFIKIAFKVAGTVMLVIPLTAIMAFGTDLVHSKVGLLGASHKLIYYSEDFKGRLDFIYYIVSFYLFLNVTAFSVYIIVIRENIFKLFFPRLEPNRVSKHTLAFSLLLLGAILLVSFVLRNEIQTALSFTAGIFGSIILFVIPCLEAYKARKLSPQKPSVLNSHSWMPLFLMGLGIVFMCFQLYQIISNLLK